MIRTRMSGQIAAVFAACALGACADFNQLASYYDPATYGSQHSNYESVYGNYLYKSFVPGTPPAPLGPLVSGAPADQQSYAAPSYAEPEFDKRAAWPQYRDDYDWDDRVFIDYAEYESFTGRMFDVTRKVRDKCHGDGSCTVKASKKSMDVDEMSWGTELTVQYRCGRGKSRTARIKEGSSQSLRC